MSALAFDPRAYLDRLHRPQPQATPPQPVGSNVVSFADWLAARAEVLTGFYDDPEIAAERALVRDVDG